MGRNMTGQPHADPWWVTLHMRHVTDDDDRRRQTPTTFPRLTPYTMCRRASNNITHQNFQKFLYNYLHIPVSVSNKINWIPEVRCAAGLHANVHHCRRDVQLAVGYQHWTPLSASPTVALTTHLLNDSTAALPLLNHRHCHIHRGQTSDGLTVEKRNVELMLTNPGLQDCMTARHLVLLSLRFHPSCWSRSQQPMVP